LKTEVVMSELEELISGDGRTMFLLGNEAIARAVLEAGVGVAATYPGTPSSEVGDVLSLVAKRAGIYFEFSTNEIVALEVAAAAAMSGVRSFAFMKHVGINVASDALMSTAYTGTKAGLVIMTADDPSMFSSQNEQDNRHYAEMARLPLIEPSNPQEAKDFLTYSFDVSEEVGSPVMFRTTTRVSHMRGLVKCGPRRPGVGRGTFHKDPSKIVLLPAVAYRMKRELLARVEALELVSEKSPLNRVEHRGGAGGSPLGFVASGAAYNSLMDALNLCELDADVLKLGMPNPLPKEMVSGFLSSHDRVVVVEELDPFLEGKIRALAQMRGHRTIINGKMDGHFDEAYEYNPDGVASTLSTLLGFKLKERSPIVMGDVEAPPRPPVLCPGCPHRATFYAVSLVSKQMGGRSNVIYPSDIGCYTLGVQRPYFAADYLLCMGSSTGTACGFSRSTEQRTIAFIGDSTFFHAGIPGLINAVHNGHKFVLVILDNRTTAMTGNQSNPGVPLNGMLEDAPEVSIEQLVKSIGVRFVRTVDPFDERSTMLALREATKFDGVSVVISKRECALLKGAQARREAGQSQEPDVYRVDQEKCVRCMNCVENFACPAFYVDSGGAVSIDPTLCNGCGVCQEKLICPPGAIASYVAGAG
jgi:indolepyruvate ferredoxin oxidoreductase alpha subunit